MFEKLNAKQNINTNNFLLGRKKPINIPSKHHFNGRRILPPWPKNFNRIVLGMGCFWGVEKLFWNIKGVFITSAGYSGGLTQNPTYEEVCSGLTGHAECIEIIYDPKILTIENILKLFFESHNPTQGNRQGNDYGSQYRSIIFYDNNFLKQTINLFKNSYQSSLLKNQFGKITTEVSPLGNYFYAEEFHQQYLSKIPNGYCNLKGTGVECIIKK